MLKTTLKYSVNMLKLSWCLTKAFFAATELLNTIDHSGRYSACYQRRKMNTNPETNPRIYNGDLHIWYAGAIVAKILWEQSTTI